MSDPLSSETTAEQSAVGEAETGPQLGGRLHPSVIALWSLRGVAPVAVLWLADALQQVVALIVLTGVVAASWVRWLRFTWQIDDAGLVVEQGLVERSRRVIPIERIQAVQAVRKLRHRAFGVVGLRIEAVGGSDTEGQLDALTPDVARRAQQVLLRRPASTPEEASSPADGPHPAAAAAADAPSRAAPAGTVLARCSPRMLLVAGLTGGRVGVAAAAIGLAQQVFGDRIGDAVVSAPERFGLAVVLLLVVLGVVVAFALSVVATAVTYWDFTVRRDGALLGLHRGLLDERKDTVPIRRVQSLTVEQNILRRALGLASVKMVVAGRAGDDSDVTNTLLPIGDRADALRVAGEIFGTGDLAAVELAGMPTAARRRRLVRAVAATGALTLAGIVGVELAGLDWPAGLAGLLSAAFTVPAALASYRALGWAQHRDAIVARSGWLVQRVTITPTLATQSARLSRAPFQRRHDLATLHLEIARTRGARDPRLLDIGIADGTRLQHEIADAVARSG